MINDPALLDYLDRYSRNEVSYQQAQAAPPQVPSSNLWGRGLSHVANLPSNVLNTGMQAMVNLGLAPESQRVPGFVDVAPARTSGEQIVDIVGEQFAPQLGWAAATYGLGGAAGKALGMNKVGADILGNVVSGAALGAVQSPQEAVIGGAFGAGYGAAAWLPRAQRLLPLAGLAAADTATAYATTGNSTIAGIQGAAGFLTGMLPGNPSFPLQKPTPEAQSRALALRQEQSPVPVITPNFVMEPSARSVNINPVPYYPWASNIPNRPQPQLMSHIYDPNPSTMEAVYGPDYWRQQEIQSAEIASEVNRRNDNAIMDQWIASEGQARVNRGLVPYGVLPPNREGMRRASSAAMSFDGDAPYWDAGSLQEYNLQRYKREQAAKLGQQRKTYNELFPGVPLKRVTDSAGNDTYAIDEVALRTGDPNDDLAPWDYPQESGIWSNTAPARGFTQAAYDFGGSLSARPRAVASMESELARQREIYANLPKNNILELQVAGDAAARVQFLEESLQGARGEADIRMSDIRRSDEEKNAELDRILAEMGIAPLTPPSLPLSERARITEVVPEGGKVKGIRHGRVGGRVMMPPEAMGGAIGATLGSQFGDTEEERMQNAAYGLMFGFGVPAASRVLGPDVVDMARRGSLNAAQGLKDLGVAARETAEATAQELANVSRAVSSNVKSIFTTPPEILARAPKVILDEPPLMKLEKQLQIYRDMQASGVPVNRSEVLNLEAQVKAMQPMADIEGEFNVRRQFDPAERPENFPFTISRSVPFLQKHAERKTSLRFVEEDPIAGPIATWELRQNKEGSYYTQKQGDPSSRVDFQSMEAAANYLDAKGAKLQNKTILKEIAESAPLPARGITGQPFVGPLDAIYGITPKIPQPGYASNNRPNQLTLLPGYNARTPAPVTERTGIPREQTKLRQQFTNEPKPQTFKRSDKKKGEAGYTDVRIPVTIGGPLIGGLAGAGYGAYESEGDPASIALYGFLGALGGGVISHSLLNAIEPPLTKTQKIGQAPTPVKEAIKEVLSTPLKDQAGREVYGNPTWGSKLMRVLEQNGFKVPVEVKAMFTQARGAAAEHLQLLNDVVKRTTNFEVPDTVKASATRFIEGQAIDPQKLQNEILRQGGLTETEWNKLKNKPVNYHTWEVGDEVYYMKPNTFSAILKQTEAEFRAQIPPDFADYADLMVASRNAMNGLQELFALGVGGTTGQKIKSSIGKHVVKTYDLFTNPKYNPTMDQIYRAAQAESDRIQGDDLAKYLGGSAINDWRAMTEQSYQEALRRGTPSQIATLQKYKKLDFSGSKSTDVPAGRYYVGPSAYEKIILKSDVEAMSMRIKQYITERKEEQIYGEITGSQPSGSELIDTSLLKRRKQFTPEFAEVLGVTKDPFARMAHSIDRLVASSVASKYVDSIKQVEFDNGLKAAYDNQTAWRAERDRLDALLQSSPSSERAGILSKLEELATYKFLDSTGLRVGVLKDAMVSRYVYDQLRGYNKPWAFWDNAVGKIASDFSRWSKIVHAPYSPITQVRNAITAPMFMWIGRASPTDAWTAAKALKGKDETYRELLRNGIITADEVTNEMTKNVDKVVEGSYDNALLSKLKKPFKNTHEFIMNSYQVPDQVVRASTYLSAKKRWASHMNLPLDDPRVIEKAVEWTDRYTMNYDNIAPLVRNLRRAPLVNIYIGYVSEMARITKNLVVDAYKGDAFGNRMHALGILGGLAGAAEGIQTLSESQLSEKDRKEWEMTQRLAPDYSRSRYKYVTGKDEKGNFKYIDFTPLLITDNFNQMFRTMAAGDIEGFMAVNPVVGWENTPIYRIMAEQIAGESLRNEREFRGFDDRVRAVAGAMLPNWTPSVGYEWQKWGQAALGVENLKTGRGETINGQIFKYLTGMSATTVNPNSVRKSAFAKFNEEIKTHKKYLRDVLNTTLPAEVKEREIKKYRQAVEYLTAEMLTKIGGSNILPEGSM